MKDQTAVLAMAIAFGMISAACGSGSSGSPSGGGSTGKSGGSSGSGGAGGSTSSGGVTGSGGTTSSGGKTGAGGTTSSGGKTGAGGSTSSGGRTGSGGSSGSGGGGSCPDVTPCGGDVLGTWNATSSCIKVSGQFDPSKKAGLACTEGTVTGSLQVTGTWTAKSGGAYTDETATKGDYQFSLPAPCKELSGMTVSCDGIGRVIAASLGFASYTQTDAADGGCTIVATMDQQGAPGLVLPYVTTTGNYTTSSNVLTMSEDETKYDYCVSGNTMTWSPQSDVGTMTGTVVFQKQGTGSGGAGGSGGKTGAGGAAGSGGGPASGGRTGSGGGPASGGRTGATGGSTASGGATGTGGATTGGTTGNRTDGPCDIYKTAGQPCAAAYSTVRALTKTYSGPLYQVRKNSSNTNQGTGGSTSDIAMLADGYADSAAVDSFCGGTICTVSLLYDQSGNGNNIGRAPKGNTSGGATGAEDDYESSATSGAVTAGGHKVYPLFMKAHDGYRTAVGVKGKSMPLGTSPEGIYELADGTHAGTQCCWDFGNVTTNPTQYGIMNTLFFGIAFWGNGAGSGPWFMADFEAGVWAGGSKVGDPGWGALNDAHPSNPANPTLKVPFAFGILKTDPNNWSLKMADAATASALTTAYEGGLPKKMDNLGGIVLGVGGDNSNNSFGTFYEGAIVAGFPSNDTDLAVFNNVKAVGYKK